MLLIGPISEELEDYIEINLENYNEGYQMTSYVILSYNRPERGLEVVEIRHNGKEYYIEYDLYNDLAQPIFREIYSCESCGKKIIRGYGKVCSKCEKN